MKATFFADKSVSSSYKWWLARDREGTYCGRQVGHCSTGHSSGIGIGTFLPGGTRCCTQTWPHHSGWTDCPVSDHWLDCLGDHRLWLQWESRYVTTLVAIQDSSSRELHYREVLWACLIHMFRDTHLEAILARALLSLFPPLQLSLLGNVHKETLCIILAKIVRENPP